jgi:ParB family transcriptional regulator, chromosome partitioning protein
MNKERRLGRGLEALLGQLPPVRNESAAPPVQSTETTMPVEAVGPDTVSLPVKAEVPSAEALFRLDFPHVASGTFAGQPHHPPAQTAPAHHAPIQTAQAAPAVNTTQVETSLPNRVNVHQIDSNPAQPRQDFSPDEMRSLTESISAHGLLQPVVVRRVHDRYQLVAGERRLRAAIQAGWVDVPVNVVEADDRQMAELAIVENLQRKDLNALEKAASFQKYLEQYGCTQEELAGRLKLDRSTIANLIRLLELPEAVQDAIRRGKISQGHARALLPLGDENEQIQFCQRIQREGLNVRQTESMVQEMIAEADQESLAGMETTDKHRSAKRTRSEHIASLEQQFRSALGMKVKIAHNAKGRGKLTVQFRNHEEFERLKKHVCGG